MDNENKIKESIGEIRHEIAKDTFKEINKIMKHFEVPGHVNNTKYANEA